LPHRYRRPDFVEALIEELIDLDFVAQNVTQ
jgi:hypothetical protein